MGNNNEVKYAGFWLRFIAFMIDLFIIGFAFKIILSLILTDRWTNIMFILPLFWFYYGYIVYLWHATLGKKIVGLEILNYDLTPMSLMKTSLRFFYSLITYGILFSPLFAIFIFGWSHDSAVYIGILLILMPILMMFVTQRKQVLHDYLSDTIVISTLYEEEEKQSSIKTKVASQKMVRNLAILVLVLGMIYELYYFIFFAFIFGSYGTFMLNQSRHLPNYQPYEIDDYNDTRIAYYIKDLELAEKENIFALSVDTAFKSKIRQDLALNCIGYFLREYDEDWSKKVQVRKNKQPYVPMDILSQRNGEKWEFYREYSFQKLNKVEEYVSSSTNSNISQNTCEKLEPSSTMFYKVLPLFIKWKEEELKKDIYKMKSASVVGKLNKRFYQQEIIKIEKLLQILYEDFPNYKLDNNISFIFENRVRDKQNISSFSKYEKDKKRGVSPLYAAIQNGLDSEVIDLLNKGENIESKNKYASPPLIFAIEKNDLSIVEILLSHGANPDVLNGKGMYTALSKASMENKVSIVKLLLKSRADINYQHNKSQTALMVAVKRCENFELIKLLLDKGANPYLKDKDGETIFDKEFASCINKEDIEKMKKLLAEKSAFNQEE